MSDRYTVLTKSTIFTSECSLVKQNAERNGVFKYSYLSKCTSLLSCSALSTVCGRNGTLWCCELPAGCSKCCSGLQEAEIQRGSRQQKQTESQTHILPPQNTSSSAHSNCYRCYRLCFSTGRSPQTD